MKQNRWLFLFAAIAITAGSLAVTPAAHAADVAKNGATASTRASKTRASKANALRQFTGVVTAVDKAELTVEKRGKAPRALTFVRHEEMKSVGNVAKNARVTVFYREDGGRAVAHRIVVKEANAG